MTEDIHNHIESECSTHLKNLIEVYLKKYNGVWTDAFDELFLSDARSLIQKLEATYRGDPDFVISADLSNIGDRKFLPGTEQLGEEIKDLVRNAFHNFRTNYRSA